MKVEKDGIIKNIEDGFMLGDYLNAGWKVYEEKPIKVLKTEKEDK